MTLARRLSLLLVVLVVALGGSGLIISTMHLRSFLALKLTEQAQHAANSIAIAVAQQPQSPRNAGIISSAYVDRDDLRTIKIVDRNGALLAEQSPAQTSTSVPGWFSSLMSLPPVEVAANIVNEKQAVGSVIVTPNTEPVYRDIWELFASTLIASFITMFLAIVFSAMSLRELFKPLKAIEQQAIAIGDKQYVVQNTIPSTPDLAAIVKAMNHMSNEVETAFHGYSKTIDRLYDLANKDQVTGWLRREPFLLKVRDLLSSGEACPGVFAVINLGDLQSLNREIGYEQVNEWIVSTVVGLMDAIQTADLSVCGRVRGAELSVLAVGVSLDEVSLRIRAMLHTLAQQASGQVQPVAAVVQIDHAPDVSLLFTVVDEMLAKGAGSSEPLQRKMLGKEIESKGRQLWREILRATFKLDQPNTQFVPVKSIGLRGKAYLRVWLECLDDQDEPLNAKMVEALCREEGHGVRHSLALLRSAKSKLAASKTSIVCVPVMLDDLIEGGALATELKTFSSDFRHPPRLVVEFTEFDALRHQTSMGAMVESLISQGIGVGMSKMSGYLPAEVWINWSLTYIVLDSSWCLALENDHHTIVWQQFVKSARERGILVWGEWAGFYDTQRVIGDWVDGWVMAPEHSDQEQSDCKYA